MIGRSPKPVETWPIDAEGWYARLRAEEPSDATWSAFTAWLEASPENARDWENVNAIWEELGQLSTSPAMLTLRERATGRTKNWQHLRLTALAASIALTVMVVGLAGSLLGVFQRDASPAFPETASGISTTLESLPGRRSSVLLSDGTTVLLDANSAIKIAYQPNTRGVLLLRGRAKFDVAKDPQRPFLVTANGRTVTAIGTSFNVNIAPQSVEVGLIEGKVRVADNLTAGHRSVDLKAGQFLNATDKSWTVQNVTNEDLLAWTNGILIFENRRLGDIVDEVNRYSKRPIVIANPQLKDRRMSAVLQAGDLETFITGVKTFGLAHVNYSKSGEVIFVD